MDASQERVFHYHADANALGGVLTHPYKTVISTAANSSLSNAGGYNSSATVPYHLDHVLQCKAAYTHTTGGEEGEDENGNWATLTTAVVEGINLLEVVTADKVVAQIGTKHPKIGHVPSISFVGSQFVNLRINGEIVDPVLDLHPFPAPPRPKKGSASGKSPAANRLAEIRQFSPYHHSDVRKLAKKQSSKLVGPSHDPDILKRRYGWLASDDEIESRGHLLCSLVTEYRKGDSKNTYGHVIHVPGFGNVFLAELIFDGKAFHLTMIRAEMGCASSGTVSMAAARTNGNPYP
jgi:hypothetical protein